jgi:dynein heavy chain
MEHICYVTNTLNLLSGLLLNYTNKTLSDLDYEKLVIFAMAWALGGTYENADRTLFNEWIASKGGPMPSKLKENETIYDYFLDHSKG